MWYPHLPPRNYDLRKLNRRYRRVSTFYIHQCNLEQCVCVCVCVCVCGTWQNDRVTVFCWPMTNRRRQYRPYRHCTAGTYTRPAIMLCIYVSLAHSLFLFSLSRSHNPQCCSCVCVCVFHSISLSLSAAVGWFIVRFRLAIYRRKREPATGADPVV